MPLCHQASTRAVFSRHTTPPAAHTRGGLGHSGPHYVRRHPWPALHTPPSDRPAQARNSRRKAQHCAHAPARRPAPHHRSNKRPRIIHHTTCSSFAWAWAWAVPWWRRPVACARAGLDMGVGMHARRVAGLAPAAPQKQRPHHPRAQHNQNRNRIEPLGDREGNTILHCATTSLNGTSFTSPTQQRARRRLQLRNAPSAGASAAPPHNDHTRMLATHASPPSTTPRAARTTRWCRRRHNGPARPARGVAGQPARSTEMHPCEPPPWPPTPHRCVPGTHGTTRTTNAEGTTALNARQNSRAPKMRPKACRWLRTSLGRACFVAERVSASWVEHECLS